MNKIQTSFNNFYLILLQFERLQEPWSFYFNCNSIMQRINFVAISILEKYINHSSTTKQRIYNLTLIPEFIAWIQINESMKFIK